MPSFHLIVIIDFLIKLERCHETTYAIGNYFYFIVAAVGMYGDLNVCPLIWAVCRVGRTVSIEFVQTSVACHLTSL